MTHLLQPVSSITCQPLVAKIAAEVETTIAMADATIKIFFFIIVEILLFCLLYMVFGFPIDLIVTLTLLFLIILLPIIIKEFKISPSHV